MDNLTEFMKERQLKNGHPFNIFEYVEAVSEFYQTVDTHDESITDEQFKLNKNILKLCFDSFLITLKDFGIKESDGFLLDYFKENK